MTTPTSGATVRRWMRRSSVLLVTLLAMTMGVVALSQSAANATPLSNSVTQTAFIWNCPTGAPNCYPEVQTRVGDVRVGDPIVDVCAGTFSGNQKNLIFNQTGRTGAAERTGFLYRSNLSSKSQRDSCYTGGVPHTAIFTGATLRLCPYDTCGRTGGVPMDSQLWKLRDFCGVTRSGVDWRLVVAFRTDTNGPLTAGFVRAAQLDDPFIQTASDCDLI